MKLRDKCTYKSILMQTLYCKIFASRPYFGTFTRFAVSLRLNRLDTLARLFVPLRLSTFRYSRSLGNIKVNFVFRSLIRTFANYFKGSRKIEV